MSNPENHPFIKQSNLYGIRFGLETIRSCLDSFGNPQNYFKTIHIAGTNGKGSTARILSESLKACGLKTGLYISPHIQKINERFQIDNKPISDARLNKIFTAIENKKIESMTYFEICTAAAFIWFKEEKVEIVVVETGMGGRLDATNVINSKYVVIASIGADHQNFLGRTLVEIANEKAAIIHGNANVIFGKISENIVNDIKLKYPEASFYSFGKDFSVERMKNGKLIYKSKGRFNGFQFKLNLNGQFQFYNSGMALQVLELLKMNEKKIQQALSHLKWKGRFDIIQKNPPIIFDAAHNVPAVKALIKSIKFEYPGLKFSCICGFCRDKQYLQIITLLADICYEIILIPFDSPRNVHPDEIIKKVNIPLKKSLSFYDAVSPLQKSKRPVLACGSFYVLEQAYNWRDNRLI